MQGRGQKMQSIGRRRACKTAGALFLILLSGALGCHGAGDHLRNQAANDVPTTSPSQGQSPRMIPASDPPAAPTTQGGAAGIMTFEPAKDNDDILQVSATQIIPPTEKTETPSSVSSLMRAVSAPVNKETER